MISASMANPSDAVEQIDDEAYKAARAFLARHMVTRADPKYQARQLQSLAIAMSVLAQQYGVPIAQLHRLVGAAHDRVVDARRCTTAEVGEA